MRRELFRDAVIVGTLSIMLFLVGRAAQFQMKSARAQTGKVAVQEKEQDAPFTSLDAPLPAKGHSRGGLDVTGVSVVNSAVRIKAKFSVVHSKDGMTFFYRVRVLSADDKTKNLINRFYPGKKVETEKGKFHVLEFDQSIDLSELPKGKYYVAVDVLCLPPGVTADDAFQKELADPTRTYTYIEVFKTITL